MIMATTTENRMSQEPIQVRISTGILERRDRNARPLTVVLRNQRESKRGSYMLRMIQNHYTLIEPVKTPLELSRESWLFPAISVPFNRWSCMPAAFLIQFCCGSLFTWIVFDKPIDKFIYGSAVHVATPYTFYIAVALIGISAVLMGPWLERKGPKMASIFGGALFFLGNILVAVALHMKQMWLVYVGYGVSAGYGIGLCFISPVSALQKWFPDRRGLASGIAVAGFGAGSLVSSKLEMFLIEQMDLPLTFVILGVAYFMCILMAGMILRTPPPGYMPNNKQSGQYSMKRLATICEDLNGLEASLQTKEWTLLEALGSTDFRLMYAMFFANLLFNLGSTSKWTDMITVVFHKSEKEASNVILVKGCFDLGGRILFPLLSDYLGRKNTYFVMLTSQIVVLTGFYFVTISNSYWCFVMSMCVVATCYGGGFGTISVLLVEKFGTVNVGPCFAVMITAWSFAGIIGGVLYEIVAKVVDGNGNGLLDFDLLSCNVTVWILLSCMVLGWIALVFVKPTDTDCQVYKVIKVCFQKVCTKSSCRLW